MNDLRVEGSSSSIQIDPLLQEQNQVPQEAPPAQEVPPEFLDTSIHFDPLGTRCKFF